MQHNKNITHFPSAKLIIILLWLKPCREGLRDRCHILHLRTLFNYLSDQLESAIGQIELCLSLTHTKYRTSGVCVCAYARV